MVDQKLAPWRGIKMQGLGMNGRILRYPTSGRIRLPCLIR